MKHPRRQKGFTMVELMVVIVIVAILASVAIPLLFGRIERAKLTEGMSACSAIATSLSSYVAENPKVAVDFTTIDLTSDLGFASADLEGKYFTLGDYAITSGSYDPETGMITYTIKGTPSKSNGPPVSLILTKTANGNAVFTYEE